MPRYLTKSRFKLAAECPTKLAYTAKEDYADTKRNDEFLKSLARGGFQIGELAKLMFPDGIEITQTNHADQIAETQRLMALPSVVIFEAAICFGNFFARVDILKKAGNRIELIEVKAKTFNPLLGPDNFEKKDGSIKAGMLPYLQDVAFQKWLLSKAYPEMDINSFLMMCDNTVSCTVNGLNQKFKISVKTGPDNRSQMKVTVAPGTTRETIGAPIVKQVNVDKYVQQILTAPLDAPGVSGFFETVVTDWADKYVADARIPAVIGAHCGKCEFRTNSKQQNLKNGFIECWKESLNWNDEDFEESTVLDLYKLVKKKKNEFIAANKIKLSDIQFGDLNLRYDDNGLTLTERQSMQLAGKLSEENPIFIDRDRIQDQVNQWEFPYYFIDFETCGVAVPFFAGKFPYAPVAFQFSVHTMDRDGSVKHSSQFLDARPGIDPTYDFARELKIALGTTGTVFMWSPYENTILNKIYDDMCKDIANAIAPTDVEELKDFINTLVIRKNGTKVAHRGERPMVDLCKIADKCFFHPDTQGRSSIKVVLPAVLKSSDWLKKRYSHAIYGSDGGIPSHNFLNWVWWQADKDGNAINPYDLLPPVFSDLLQESIDDAEDDDDDFEVNEGGAASTAFARLQFENLSDEQRSSYKNALLKYCELDTLAMVMIFEAWREWITE